MGRDYKFVVLGSGGVGKSALSVRFVQGVFVDQYDPTIEDSYRKVCDIDKQSCMLEILDTAGTENFAAMRDLYLRNGQGFLLVYSVQALATFNDLRNIREAIMRIKNPDPGVKIPICVAGNKCDVAADDRTITKEQGANLAKEWDCSFYETSAKNNVNVEEVFFDLVRQVNKYSGDGPAKPKKGGGCLLL